MSYWILIAPPHLDQVLLNLCVNARDALDGVGLIYIDTAHIALQGAPGGTDGPSAGDYIVISVRDTGKGLDAQTKDRIFEPFFTTKPVGQGTGLGLATVFGVVKQHGGFVAAETEPGQGTTIHVYFPVHNAANDALASLASTPYPAGHEVILVVEDEVLHLKVVARALESSGYTVWTATSPLEALELIEAHPELDLLLTDVVMPDLNGLELARRARVLAPHLRCLFMSGYAGGLLEHGDLERRGVVFLQKPLFRRLLATSVRAVLDSALVDVGAFSETR